CPQRTVEGTFARTKRGIAGAGSDRGWGDPSKCDKIYCRQRTRRSHSQDRNGAVCISMISRSKAQGAAAQFPGSARASRALSGASPESSEEIRYSKRWLPHFERPWAKYAVSFSTLERRSLTHEERD